MENDFNHGTLSFSAPTYTVNENDGTATIIVTRADGDNGAVSVDYSTQDGTALEGADYTGRTGTLSFLSGQTSKTFAIPIREDTAIEPDETVRLRLSIPRAGPFWERKQRPNWKSSTTILPPGRVRFTGANFNVDENGGTAAISVKRAGGNAGVLSVQYATSDGTAILPFDYLETAGVLNWDDGDSSTKVFMVQISNDGLVEGNETVGLALFNPSISGALGNVTNATLTIVDDDFYGELAFNSAEYWRTRRRQRDPHRHPARRQRGIGLGQLCHHPARNGHSGRRLSESERRPLFRCRRNEPEHYGSVVR